MFQESSEEKVRIILTIHTSLSYLLNSRRERESKNLLKKKKTFFLGWRF